MQNSSPSPEAQAMIEAIECARVSTDNSGWTRTLSALGDTYTSPNAFKRATFALAGDDPAWRSVGALLMGMIAEHNDPAQSTVTAALHDALGKETHPRCAHALITALAVSADIATVDQVVIAVREWDDDVMACAAVGTVARVMHRVQTVSPTGGRFLLEALESDSLRLRLTALDVFSGVLATAKGSAIQRLLEASAIDERADVSLNAIAALVAREHENAPSLLLDHLQTHGASALGLSCVRVLSSSHASVFAPWAHESQNSPLPDVRVTAYRVLAHVEGGLTVENGRRLFTSVASHDFDVSYQALLALAHSDLDGPETRNEFRSQLQADDFRGSVAALGLARRGSPIGRSIVEQQLSTAPATPAALEAALVYRNQDPEDERPVRADTSRIPEHSVAAILERSALPVRELRMEL